MKLLRLADARSDYRIELATTMIKHLRVRRIAILWHKIFWNDSLEETWTGH